MGGGGISKKFKGLAAKNWKEIKCSAVLLDATSVHKVDKHNKIVKQKRGVTSQNTMRCVLFVTDSLLVF